jgi:uncharacterized protein (DUF58 family)
MVRVTVLPEEARSPGRRETNDALALSKRMPRLVLEARRVAATLAHGLHGRRRAGTGESFWQFRPFVTGEAAQRIDWRRSARDDRLYVREREWETAHTIWLWVDRSASMGYRSDLAQTSKIDRALVLGLALGDTFVEGGERVGVLGLMPPRATRQIAEKIAESFVSDRSALEDDLPPAAPIATLDEAILIGDFLYPLNEIEEVVRIISSRGSRGHLVMIVGLTGPRVRPLCASSLSSRRRAARCSEAADPCSDCPSPSRLRWFLPLLQPCRPSGSCCA